MKVIPYTYSPELISRYEEVYNVKFIMECPALGKYGFTDDPWMLFYQANPQTELGHSNYMLANNEVVINGLPTVQKINETGFKGFIDEDGILQYSSYRHHMNKGLDGGFDYTRVIGSTNNLKKFTIENNTIKEL